MPGRLAILAAAGAALALAIPAASPRPPAALRQAAPAADRSARTARGRDHPEPQLLHRPRGAALARLRRQLLRPLGRPGPRRAEPQGHRTATGSPTTSNGCSRSPNTSTRSRTTSSAGGSRSPTATLGGGHGETDIYLSEIGGELFGYAAPDRDQAVDGRQPAPPARLPRPRQRLQPFEFPAHRTGPRPQGDPRPRVQPHPPVRLRRLRGPLVRRVDRGLDGGPGLQRDRRLPALRAPLGEAVGNAADRELDQGVRDRGLERVAGPPLRPRDHPRSLGRAPTRTSPDGFAVAAYERAIHAAGPSSFGHDFTRFAADVAEWRTGIGFRESYLYPDMPRQGTLDARRAAGRPAASTTPPSA